MFQVSASHLTLYLVMSSFPTCLKRSFDCREGILVDYSHSQAISLLHMKLSTCSVPSNHAIIFTLQHILDTRNKTWISSSILKISEDEPVSVKWNPSFSSFSQKINPTWETSHMVTEIGFCREQLCVFWTGSRKDFLVGLVGVMNWSGFWESNAYLQEAWIYGILWFSFFHYQKELAKIFGPCWILPHFIVDFSTSSYRKIITSEVHVLWS